MKRKTPYSNCILNRFCLFTAFVLLMGITSSCSKKLFVDPGNVPIRAENPYHPEKSKWLNWNVLFIPGTTQARQNQTMDSIKKYVSDYLNTQSPPFAVDHYFFSCPCDPTFVNYTVTPVAGAGSAPIPPPPPGKGVGGSGDGIDYVKTNASFVVDSLTEYMDTVNHNNVILNTSSVDDSKILAVMDTGLDSAYFQNNFQTLLWNDPFGRNIRNFMFFMNGRNLEYFWDDDKFKHGTAVTTLALQALERFDEQNHAKPRVMILKALDNNRNGSTFTISCALSYAIQHHATMINASLGYYGALDSILLRYADRTVTESQTPIVVFAAAGNTPGRHFDDQLCSLLPNNNLLMPGRLFYPGCFSIDHTNFITVTGLTNSLTACFYQNYSSVYVNLGVVPNPGTANCCRLKVPFNNSGYEGSSFATPVISGKVMACLMTMPGSTVSSCVDFISPIPSPIPPAPVTKEGRFLNYMTP